MLTALPLIFREADKSTTPTSSEPADIEAAILAASAGPEPEETPEETPAEDEPAPESDQPLEDEEAPAEEAAPADDLRAELAALRAELAELRAEKPVPATPPAKEAAPAPKAGGDPIASAETHEALDALEQRSEDLRDWCLTNWDGGTVGEGENEKELTASEVRAIYAQHDRIVRKGIPARRAAIDGEARAATARQNFEAEAGKTYAWMKDAKHPARQVFDTFAKFGANLTQHPSWPLILAHAVAGLEAAKAAKGKKFPSATPLPASRKDAQPAPRITAPPINGGAGGSRRPGASRSEGSIAALAAEGATPEGIEKFLVAAMNGRG